MIGGFVVQVLARRPQLQPLALRVRVTYARTRHRRPTARARAPQSRAVVGPARPAPQPFRYFAAYRRRGPRAAFAGARQYRA